MNEQWEVCEDFPDFGVSNLGFIEDIERSRLVPTRVNQQGILMVTIKDPTGKQFTRSVALLVARAFVTKPNKHFDSIIHLNGERTDCRAFNLMWRSRPFALRYHDMFNHAPYRVSVHIPQTDEYFYSLREACTTYGLVEEIAFHSMYNNEPCFPYGWTLKEVTDIAI